MIDFRPLFVSTCQFCLLNRFDRFHITSSLDVALHAYDSFFRDKEEGRLSKQEERESLWWLLVAKTSQRVLDGIRAENALKRKEIEPVECWGVGGNAVCRRQRSVGKLELIRKKWEQGRSDGRRQTEAKLAGRQWKCKECGSSCQNIRV